jgi:hypothetical protein
LVLAIFLDFVHEFYVFLAGEEDWNVDVNFGEMVDEVPSVVGNS